MTTYRAQVTLPYFTNFPEDVITNTFHFEDFNSLGLAAVAAEITPLLDAFYTGAYTGTNFAANYVVWANVSVSWYDLSQPEPRVPLILPMAISVTGAVTTIPTEVAVVLSFQGTREAGVPQSRRRGRVYLGGLGTAWFTPSSSSSFPVLATAAINQLANRALDLRAAVIAADMTWRVWSPTDQVSIPIVDGWIDNSPDTQRRRSVDATQRQLWPSP